jgi:hypothetical protein
MMKKAFPKIGISMYIILLLAATFAFYNAQSGDQHKNSDQEKLIGKIKLLPFEVQQLIGQWYLRFYPETQKMNVETKVKLNQNLCTSHTHHRKWRKEYTECVHVIIFHKADPFYATILHVPEESHLFSPYSSVSCPHNEPKVKYKQETISLYTVFPGLKMQLEGKRNEAPYHRWYNGFMKWYTGVKDYSIEKLSYDEVYEEKELSAVGSPYF